MYEDIKLAEKSRYVRNQFPYGLHNESIDIIAKEIDALPDFDLIKNTDPQLYNMLWNNLSIPESFLFNENRELALSQMIIIDNLTKKIYKFDDNDNIDTNKVVSIYKIGAKFALDNPNVKVPLQLFKT